MEVINIHTIRITVPKRRKQAAIINERRGLLHRKLGFVCHDCGKKRGKGWKGMLQMHHVFYPLGYEPNWTHNWKHCSDDIFYSSYYPEVMEACVLLCDSCHMKRHNIKKTG